MIGCRNLSSQKSKCRSRKSRTSSTFSNEQKAVEPNQISPVQRYFDDSVHVLTKSAGAFCATATKSVVWKPTFMIDFFFQSGLWCVSEKKKQDSKPKFLQ